MKIIKKGEDLVKEWGGQVSCWKCYSKLSVDSNDIYGENRTNRDNIVYTKYYFTCPVCEIKNLIDNLGIPNYIQTYVSEMKRVYDENL